MKTINSAQRIASVVASMAAPRPRGTSSPTVHGGRDGYKSTLQARDFLLHNTTFRSIQPVVRMLAETLFFADLSPSVFDHASRVGTVRYSDTHTS